MRFSVPLFALLLPSLAVAQSAPAQQPGFMDMAFPMIAMVFIVYFFIMRPQMKQRKQHQEVLSQLKKGDEVLTSGGIFGTIEGLTEKFVTLEIADGVNIRVLRGNIMGTVKEVKND